MFINLINYTIQRYTSNIPVYIRGIVPVNNYNCARRETFIVFPSTAAFGNSIKSCPCMYLFSTLDISVKRFIHHHLEVRIVLLNFNQREREREREREFPEYHLHDSFV